MWRILLFLSIALSLSACVPAPVATPVPSATPESGTELPTFPVLTSTPTPIPSPTPTPAPSPSPTPTPHPPTIAEILARGEELPFEVCGESTTWVRPSEEEQNAKWWTSGRYKCADERCEQTIKDLWTHDFFVVYGSASIEYDLENLSGLWTLQGEERAKCYERERHEAVLRLEMAEVWVLLHRVKQVKRLGAFYVIVVEPTERGVQFVQFPRPAEKVPLTLYFVTADGQQIDVIAEAERPPVAPWPYPQLVPTPEPQH